MHNILVFTEIRSYLNISLEEQLQELGYNLINVGTNINEINALKEELTAILVYADSDLLKNQQALVFLRDKALENDTPFFIIGDMNELAEIRAVVPQTLIQKEFQRPIDLKDVVSEIDDYIIRLTQKARAAGIHVIIGTQRPSVDVITGVIKSNIPSRIAFRVPALVDSRTILDEAGAEKLVARGDMLLKPVGALKPTRVQGAFISEEECERITTFLRENSSENYDESIVSQIESNATKLQKAEKRNDEDGEGGGSDLDDKFYAALEIAVDSGKISSSYLQRKLNLGFQRAARIIDTMEELGYIGEPNGSKPRDVLITKQDFLELMMKRNEDDE